MVQEVATGKEGGQRLEEGASRALFCTNTVEARQRVRGAAGYPAS